MDLLTLDSNQIVALFKERPGMDAVVALLDLSDQGKVDLAVTRAIHYDIPEPMLSDRLEELPALGISETGLAARVGSWELGIDRLGNGPFTDWVAGLGVKDPDWRDFEHLHAHMLEGRDFFLTWDKGIHRLKAQLFHLWRIQVLAPESYLVVRGYMSSPPPK